MKTPTEKRNERIWATICDIPRGSVASYGQVAEIAGFPRGARQVGYALRHLPGLAFIDTSASGPPEKG